MRKKGEGTMEQKVDEGKISDKELVSGIRKKTEELNALLSEAKSYPDLQVQMRMGGVKVDSVGLVNHIEINVTRTEKL